MVCIDTSTATVVSLETGLGWSVDVTVCNLDSDLSVKDFRVIINNVVQPLTDYTKTTQTIITYSGVTSLPVNTPVTIFRFTDGQRQYCPTYGDRFQSAQYNEDIDVAYKILGEIRSSLSLGSAAGRIVQVSATDTTPSTLNNKIVAGSNISLAILNGGGDEKLQITSTGSGGGGGSGDLTAIGLITSELPLVAQPTASTNAWVAARGRDAANDGGEGLFYWDEFDTTSTADDGTIYLVQGGAGVGRWKRYREDKTWWNVKWFGVVGDAVTDNFPALDRMRTTIQTFYNDQVNTIYFPPASLSYDYSNNRWLRQLKHIRLDGYGASIRNIDAVSAFSEDRYPIQVTQYLVDNAGIQRSVLGAYKVTYNFNTIAAGETLLTFSTPGDGTNFVVGEEIIITGRQRQNGGYPSNMTYFELHRVEAVTANDITLEQPLKYAYRDDWYQTAPQLSSTPAHTFGPGSMLKVDTTTTITCRTFEARGLRFEDNPNFGGGSKFTLSGLYWGRVLDCVFDDIVYVSQTQLGIVENTRIKEIEIDKLIEDMVIKNSSLGGNGLETLVAATGVRRLHILENQITGRIRVSPIELANIQNNTVTAISTITDAAIRADSSFVTLKFQARNNIIRSPVAIPGTSIDPIGSFQTLTVDAVSGTDIILTDSSAARETAYQNLREGCVIHNGDASNIGMVTAVSGGNGTDVTIEGTWENAPSVSEVYYWTSVQTSIVENNTYDDTFNGRAPQGDATSTIRAFDGTFYPFQNEATKVVTLTSDTFAFNGTNTITVRSIIEKIEFEVDKIFTGVGPTTVDCEISRFATATSPTPPPIARNRIDLLTLGKRAISPNNWQCLTRIDGSADQIRTLQTGVYADRIQLRFRDGAADLGNYNHWELAQGTIRLFLKNPRAYHTSIPRNLSSANT